MTIANIAISVLSLADAQVAETAVRNCDLPAFQRAVDDIEDQAFASLKAANEAVAVAARTGAVGSAGDEAWARYKALRAEAERIRYANVEALGRCAASGGVVQTVAVPPASVSPAPATDPGASSWSALYDITSGRASVDTGSRVAATRGIAPLSASLDGDYNKLTLGASWTQNGRDRSGWRTSLAFSASVQDLDGGMPQTPVAPRNAGYYLPTSTFSPVPSISDSRLWQRTKGVELEGTVGYRFELEGGPDGLYVTPSARLSWGHFVIDEQESLVSGGTMTWIRDYSSQRGELVARLEVGGVFKQLLGEAGDLRWSVRTEGGVAGVDMRGVEFTYLYPTSSERTVYPLADTRPIWGTTLSVGMNVTKNGALSFSVGRSEDVFVSTPLSLPRPIFAKPPLLARKLELVPLEATLYQLSLDYRF